MRFDTSYPEIRQVPIGGYIIVRANRYSVPSDLVGHQVSIRIGLDRRMRVYGPDDSLVTTHTLKDGRNQWQLNPDHHRAIYDEIKVETRDLSRYEEAM